LTLFLSFRHDLSVTYFQSKSNKSLLLTMYRLMGVWSVLFSPYQWRCGALKWHSSVTRVWQDSFSPKINKQKSYENVGSGGGYHF